MEDLKLVIGKLAENQQFEKALDLLNKQILKEPEQILWLELRGDIYYSQQKFGDALNDFNKILKIDKCNKVVTSKAEMAQQILKFQNLDIFESTNLNLDPWLD